MPQPTNPNDKPSAKRGKDDDRGMILRSVMKAEALVQIALVLPLSVVIGWAVGDFLDHKLHQSWIAILGLFIGVVAGFVQVIRVANHANRSDGN